MAVLQADLSLKKAENSSDTAAQNGGRLTDTAITESLFPDITGAERVAGLTRYRKVFFKNEAGTGTLPLKYSDAALSLIDGKIFMENFSAADDYFLIKAGTPTNVQSGLVDSGWGATGYLVNSSIAASASSGLQVQVELNGSSGELFQVGGKVLISNYISGVGVREFLTISAVSWAGSIATLAFTSTPLQNTYYRNALTADRTATVGLCTANTIGYSGDNMTPNALVRRRVRIKSGTGSGQTRRITSNSVTTITVGYAWTTTPDGTSVYEVLATHICNCVSVGDIKCSYAGVTVTSASGTFTATSNLKLFPVGARDETWTLLFSSSTAFSITGAYYGAIPGTYTISTTSRPPNGSSYYFEIVAAAFGGTFTAGDTIVFSTVSASSSAWIKQVVLAGCAAHLGNSIDLGCSGDTV